MSWAKKQVNERHRESGTRMIKSAFTKLPVLAAIPEKFATVIGKIPLLSLALTPYSRTKILYHNQPHFIQGLTTKTGPLFSLLLIQVGEKSAPPTPQIAYILIPGNGKYIIVYNMAKETAHVIKLNTMQWGDYSGLT